MTQSNFKKSHMTS